MAEGNGNGNGNERRFLSWLPALGAYTAIVLSYGVQTTRIDALNDRFSAQAARINQHDSQFADINRALGQTTQLIATLTERLAGYATADNPRMRALEQEVAELRGVVSQMAASVQATRDYIVERGRAAQPPTGSR